jgi:small subunit ribosomal protein S20
MANIKSAIKKIRKDEEHRLHNRYYARTTRNAIKELRNTTDKTKATELLPKVASMLDKLAKTNVIHKNKAANLKSSLALHINKIA